MCRVPSSKNIIFYLWQSIWVKKIFFEHTATFTEFVVIIVFYFYTFSSKTSRNMCIVETRTLQINVKMFLFLNKWKFTYYEFNWPKALATLKTTRRPSWSRPGMANTYPLHNQTIFKDVIPQDLGHWSQNINHCNHLHGRNFLRHWREAKIL